LGPSKNFLKEKHLQKKGFESENKADFNDISSRKEETSENTTKPLFFSPKLEEKKRNSTEKTTFNWTPATSAWRRGRTTA